MGFERRLNILAILATQSETCCINLYPIRNCFILWVLNDCIAIASSVVVKTALSTSVTQLVGELCLAWDLPLLASIAF
jgi:hypothetical protein